MYLGIDIESKLIRMSSVGGSKIRHCRWWTQVPYSLAVLAAQGSAATAGKSGDTREGSRFRAQATADKNMKLKVTNTRRGMGTEISVA